MLFEFSFQNVGCFKERQTFSMVASADKSHRRQQVFGADQGHPDSLCAALVYGANASGKSTFVTALGSMRGFVLDSAKEGQVDEVLDDFAPHLFDQATATQPSEFEIIFQHEGVRFQYGFAVDRKQVHEEWLMAYPEGRAQTWFQRKGGRWHFGPKFKGPKKVYQSATRSNALFLSTAVQLNCEQLRPIFQWFSHKLHVLPSNRVLPFYSMELCEDQEGKAKVLRFLNDADLGIEDVRIEKRQFSEMQIPADTPPDVVDKLKDRSFFRAWISHRPQGADHATDLKFSQESGGTQTMFALADPFIETLESGAALVIDELHHSLHPHLTAALIAKFNPSHNPNRAQLIFTTHDTTLMRPETVRRDQIWFAERDPNTLASSLFPLSDLSPRKMEAFAKAYLDGRYGAVPFISLHSGD